MANPCWRTRKRVPTRDIPAGLKPWLYEEHSLTGKLKYRCPGLFSLQLLDQFKGHPTANERTILCLHSGRIALIRRVQLLCADKPLVFARSIIPLETLDGGEKRLAHLGSKPLADILFAHPMMRRGEMEFARLVPGQPLFTQAAASLGEHWDEIWGRRSLFNLNDKPLLVTEVFSPELADDR